MGAFDDLIPQKQEGNPFSDLIPQGGFAPQARANLAALHSMQPLPTPGLLGQVWQTLNAQVTPQDIVRAATTSPFDAAPQPSQAQGLLPAANRLSYEALKGLTTPLSVGSVGIAPRVLAAKGAIGGLVNAAARGGLLEQGAQAGIQRLTTPNLNPEQKAALDVQTLTAAAPFAPFGNPRPTGLNANDFLASRPTGQVAENTVPNPTPPPNVPPASPNPFSPFRDIPTQKPAKPDLSQLSKEQLEQGQAKALAQAQAAKAAGNPQGVAQALITSQQHREELNNRFPLTDQEKFDMLHKFGNDATKVAMTLPVEARGQILAVDSNLRQNADKITRGLMDDAYHQLNQIQKTYAKTIRENQGLGGKTGQVPQGGETNRGGNVEQGASGQSEPVAARVGGGNGPQVQGKSTRQAQQSQGALHEEGQKPLPGGQQTNARGSGSSVGGVPLGNVQGLNITKGEKAVYPLSRSEKGGLKDALGRKVDTEHKTTGESGFVILPKETWDSLFGSNKSAKIDPQQMMNRLRNKLGEASSAFEAMKTAGLGAFLNQPRSVNEVEDWAEKNAPKVEVRKFGEGATTPEQKERNAIQHWFETKHGGFPEFTFEGTEQEPAMVQIFHGKALQGDSLDAETLAKAKRFDELGQIIANDKTRPMQEASWQSIAPKSEQEMPGYTEIAVVKPVERVPFVSKKDYAQLRGIREDEINPALYEAYKESGNTFRREQFPSSHSFPPNTLGFARGYMETLPNGKKVFHVIEVQSDWAQQRREFENDEREAGVGNTFSGSKGVQNDPLLRHYERLVLKAAIDHARSEGADAIAISDAETAMMTEGHDRNARMFTEVTPEVSANARKVIASDTGNATLRQEAQEILRHDVGELVPSFATPDSIPYLKQLENFGIKPKIQVSQAPGMRLHYDQTLPKIAGELTGEKGERVGFGEHKMARGSFNTIHGNPDEPNPFRKDLIFKTPSGELKTDVTARLFNLGKAKPLPKEFSLYGKGGFVIVPKRSEIADAVKPLTDYLGEKLDSLKTTGKDIVDNLLDSSQWQAFLNRRQGYDFPAIQAASSSLADRASKYGNANVAAQLRANVEIGKVLGNKADDENFRRQLGGVIYEDMRRGQENLPNIERLSNDPATKEQLRQFVGAVAKASRAVPDRNLALDIQGGSQRVNDWVATMLKSKYSTDAIQKVADVLKQFRALEAKGFTGDQLFRDVHQMQAVGRPVWMLKNSPIKSQAEYNRLLSDPDIKTSLAQWKSRIMPVAQEMHEKLGGRLAETGQETGVFANLIAVLEDRPQDVENAPVAKGPLTTMRRGSAFSRERKFSGEEYNLDAADMAKRMFVKNAQEYQKRLFYDELARTGNGKILKQGDTVPEGMVKLKNPVGFQTVINNGEVFHNSQWLAVKKNLVSEVQQLLQLNTSWREQLKQSAPLVDIASQVIIKTQVGLGIDLGFHVANDIAATLTSPKGMQYLPKKIVNGVKATVDLVRNTPGVQEELAKMAESGVTFRGASLGGWSSKALKVSDTVTRLILNREYDELVKEGKVVNSDAERRRYINGRAGQYNKRFMTYFQQQMQETGLGSFNVAGRNFNRLAVGQITMSPGVKAKTTADALRLRLSIATGVALALVALPRLANILTTGQAMPPGVKEGQAVIKQNKDGTYVVIDLTKLSMLGRGGRATGLSDVMSEQILPRLEGQQPATLGQTAKDAATDIGRTALSPFVGPPVNLASTLATGKSALGYEERLPGEQGPPYWSAAAASMNPLLGPAFGQQPNVQHPTLQRISSAIGVKQSQALFTQVNQWARQFKVRNNIHTDDQSYAPSEYEPLKQALLKGDTAKAKEDYQKLLASKSQRGGLTDDEAKHEAMMDIQKEFKRLENFRFVNKESEATFTATLTPQQRAIYQKVIAQQKQIADEFFKDIQQPIDNKKPRGGFQGFKARKGFHFSRQY